MDEFEKSDMTKNRPITEKTLYEWYDWLISHILESIKTSASKVKEKKYEAL